MGLAIQQLIPHVADIGLVSQQLVVPVAIHRIPKHDRPLDTVFLQHNFFIDSFGAVFHNDVFCCLIANKVPRGKQIDTGNLQF